MKCFSQLRLLLCLAGLLGLAQPVAAQIQFSSSVFYGSPYMWRGEKLSDGFVIQPTLEASMAGFSLAFFGNLDPRSPAVGEKLHFNEADLTLAYTVPVQAVSLSGGYTLYTFPTPGASTLGLSPTQEFFLSLEFEIPLTPSLLVVYDFDGDKAAGDLRGYYAELGLGHQGRLGGEAFSLNATLGLDAGYVLDNGQTALSHLALTAETGFAVGGLALTPLVGFQLSLAERYQDQFGQSVFYGGLGIDL